jgi:hypothetical protein
MLSCTSVGGRRDRRLVPVESAVLDLGRALQLLTSAAADAPDRHGLAGAALSLGAGVSEDDLARVHGIGIRALSAVRGLPVPLTLGATVVLDAAQRSQNRGETRAQALERANHAALGFLELLPERVLTAASAPRPAAAGQIRRLRHTQGATAPTQVSLATTEEVGRDER